MKKLSSVLGKSMSNSEVPSALERLILLISSELERTIKKIKNKDYLDLESKDIEVGRIVKIDYNTIGGRKGKFTRMAIFVYLNKPLVPCSDIDGFTQKIEYEGLLQICYGCRSCGHVQEVCVE
ncbi:hypothetical protein Gotri_005801 [Gossypium trilobum]|uniref:CCHC-type domain-containing protein n=1 Tax=Gossypium trilobum TaxID=34281 RepID=A0A7J9EXQ9_9ROSI|nr:hypothetical protein [Gossypium trilobum]